MRRIAATILGMVVFAPVIWARLEGPVTLRSNGWIVTADPDRAVLSVSHESLGTILQQIRLNMRDQHGLQPLKKWSANTQGKNQLQIRTSEPRTAWVFELSPDGLRIAATLAEGVLTAEAPATPDRIVARVLDPQGTPVQWAMTPETKNDYGGTQASNPSFLPLSNPEVMYFALGQVASSNLHSLFDRKTDAVIDFSEQTSMKRRLQNPDLLDIVLPVPGNTLIRFVPHYFTNILGLPYYAPFDDTYFPSAPMVWDSWSSYYEQVREEDVVRNTDWIAANLKAYGYQYVQLDDGYDRGESGTHYWTENWNQEKFPHGPKWLTDYIKSKGLHPGVWLVPNASQVPYEQHPDWFLYNKKDGKVVLDYDTPTLDSTNPQVLNFLKKEFTTLDDLGFEYYKFDGEHDFLKYVPGVDLDRIANRSVDPIGAYRNRLKVIRDTIGPRRFIEGCPAGAPLDGIGYFNSYFTGEDPYNTWLGMYSVFSSINANAFLNHLAVYVMPGEMDVEPLMSVEEAMKKRPYLVARTARTRENTPPVGFGTTPAEARTVVSLVALSGTVYSVGSMMADLPQERSRILKMTLPTMPIFPVDLFSRGTDTMLGIFRHTTPDDYIHNYPEIVDLKVNAPAGVYDVAALTNWRSWPTTRTLSFADKLGLNPEASYVAFDFWQQKLLGIFKGKMDVAIDPHDTRVLFIHPLLNHPQLVGTSRHISGAYSIDDLAWDGAKNKLRGTSKSVVGDDYTLWFYVPTGMRISRVSARTAKETAISVQHQLNANSLNVTFPGQQQPVDWAVEFAGKASR